MAVIRWVGLGIGLDVHRDFCEVAFCRDGEVRSAGRVPATPEGVGSLAESLLPSDRVALEVTGSCWEIARILEPHVNRVVVVSPDDTGITITFAWQVDRQGNRRPTKTDGSARTVPIPRELALVLARHKLASRDVTHEAFVFATCTGRALSQRNVARALRKAQQRATDEHGQPTFAPLLGKGKVPVGAVPSMHSFRHTVASRALLAGESVDEVAFLLGHRDATVTRVVYIHEIADVRRRHMRRSRMTAEYAGALRVALQGEADDLTPWRQASDGQRSTSASAPFRGGGAFL
ncbi:MAG: tyrosine-type recombinase/integrase [Solirubrobacterales bacterium]|nr:tyrosine-type recombinase/integrase [Solirubrobacterales bacterium]